MRDLNIDFMDLYKSVDRFIRDAYSSTEGVSEYIRQMEQNNHIGRWDVASWRADYDMLKRLRWIRNQLSHEVGYDSDICKEDDYSWLDDFRARLYSANDPLALMSKAAQLRQQSLMHEQGTPLAYNTETPQLQNWPPKRKSLFQRLKAFFNGE